MPTKQLVVSRYLQYFSIAVGLVLLMLFTRQISGVILTFFMAALLTHVLNPLVRHLEEMKVPRAIVSATIRYLRETLILERRRESLLSPTLAIPEPHAGKERSKYERVANEKEGF